MLLPLFCFAQAQRGSIKVLFDPAHRDVIVVAHRGCHEAAPHHSFGEAPENSLAALQHCIAMGVDMMETDIHMTGDGYLVIMHDATVDRTTNGHGALAQMTLAEVRKLRLRQNMGGPAAPLTDEPVLTLEELIRAAKGHITLNLDVKDAIYAEVVDFIVHANAADLVNVKTRAGIASPPLAAIEPFVRVPFIPILDSHGSLVAAVAAHQVSRGRPLAFELPRMRSEDLAAVAAVAQNNGVKLFCNSLGEGFIAGIGGDSDALRNPDTVWGWLYHHGITAIQTDRPEALLEFRPQLHD